MSNLKTKILKAPSHQELADVLKDSEACVSFWGKRLVTNKNFSSAASISLVAKKALQLLLPLLKGWNYSLKDRSFIITIMQKIDGFYLKTDEDLSKRNIITKIFEWLRSLSELFFPIRTKWESLPDLGNFYSAAQFKEAFPKNSLPKQPDEEYNEKKLYLSPEKNN